ncbi:Immunity protein 10 [Streptomyces zhaozhouensis]|uniref:Immunity protein 10 n=1 Tax=Streptomyces zhaozhouensis TaxID=1300267 RepID=A0A286DWD1_9ACTN|nr:Imm10 family immunity protein [Streptomyces zhaozhouensis]SOD62874.1 Immunity protein 10 [Streptomyces zhaozhouensis]
MRITAHAVGVDDDEYDDVLEAGFAEGEDGSGLAVAFQRARSAPTPWQGVLRDEDDLFDNTYCIVVGGATVYGGLLSVEFTAPTARFRFAPEDAAILRLGDSVLDVTFDASPEELAEFTTMLRRVVTWGAPSQIPRLTGL